MNIIKKMHERFDFFGSYAYFSQPLFSSFCFLVSNDVFDLHYHYFHYIIFIYVFAHVCIVM